MNRYLISFILYTLFSLSCKKDEPITYTEVDRSISITDKISVDNGVKIHNQTFNLIEYDKFLNYISASDHFLLVKLKDFNKTTSTDKVVLALRYDIDDDIEAAVKFAYREHKYGIKSTYFILHTAPYYGNFVGNTFNRNDRIVFYIKKIQDYFGHEIGFHNDLLTLQIVYDIPPKYYLKNELAYLRGNKIEISGTAYHGSPYCYTYKYSNVFFWLDWPNSENYVFVTKDNKTIKLEKDSLKNYNLDYEAGLLNQDYFYSDANFEGENRWNMKMVNLDTIKPGKKVIIMLHPQHWN
jgi:hypothetical protein